VSADGGGHAYTVHAKRWEHGWELHIDDIGVTQSRTLNDAEAMVRDYIALDTGADPSSFDVEILPEVGEGLDEETRSARQAVAAAESAQRAAARQSREVAHRLKSAGLSGREIAVVLQLSPQRVSQLLKSASGRFRHSRTTLDAYLQGAADAARDSRRSRRTAKRG
jgi:DNA-binding CsgD family transcriptional regulator